MAKLLMNGVPYEFDESFKRTILTLDNRRENQIPGLCHYDGCSSGGDCGICIVKNLTTGEYLKACETLAKDGMNIITEDEKISEMRRVAMEKIVLNHQYKCGPCEKLGKCEVLTLAAKFGVKKDFTKPQEEKRIHQTFTERRMEIDVTKCILCGRCSSACAKNTDTDAIYSTGRDSMHNLGLIYNETKCIYCGQCIKACPVNAIIEKDANHEVKELLDAGEKYMVVAIAPSVRVSLGDEFGFGYGANVEKYLFAAFKKMGFKQVFDLNFTADVTIMEESSELLDRLENNGAFPMFTSCCPGWVEIVDKHAPHLMKNISSCKSPQQMYGALTKSYFASEAGIDPENIITVSIVPCTAKKVEAEKDYQNVDGLDDIDYVLTTRELAKLMKDMKLPLTYNSDRAEADHMMADYSGAGAIFGATGGVMTAALRMAYKHVEGKELTDLEFTSLSTLDGVKTAEVAFGGKNHKVAVVNGTVNFDHFIKNHNIEEFTFIEVMACNGGCIAGGGQPFLESSTSDLSRKISRARIASLKLDDENMEIRHSQDNPMIQKLYKEFLGEPLSEKAHHLLHVHKHQGN